MTFWTKHNNKRAYKLSAAHSHYGQFARVIEIWNEWLLEYVIEVKKMIDFFLSKATLWVETIDETSAPGEPFENKTDTRFVLFL